MTKQRPQRLIFGLLVTAALIAIASCGVDEEGAPPPFDQLYYPLGLAAHPHGQYLLVSNAVFDRRYNSSYLSVIDTFSGEIIPEASVELDLYAGEIKLTETCSGDEPQGTCDPRIVGLVPSRDQNTLTSFEFDLSRDRPRVECGQGNNSQRCGGPFVQYSGLKESASDAPYSITLSPRGAYLSHINSGAVSSWYLSDIPPYISFGCQLQLPGANYVTEHPLKEGAVISDRFGQSLHHVIRSPKDGGRCELRLLDGISARSALNSETRGLAFNAQGDQLYVAQSTDGVLKVYATQLDAKGEIFGQLLASFPVGEGANIVRVAGRDSQDSEGMEVEETSVDYLGQGLIYVSSITDGIITVIDPVRLEVLSRIPVGRGAHDISFMLSEQGELRGYVSLFEEHKLSIIDLQPGSETRFTVIGEIK